MSSRPQPRYTPGEYLALERAAEFKSEFFDGQIYAMTGASRNHNRVAGNAFAALHAQLRGRPCEAFIGDMRVKVNATGLYTYPDVVVVCGGPRFEDDQVDTLLNPTVVIEVLSESTERYDRGEKFAHYRRLDSLQEYVLIAQLQVRVERYVRQGEQWLLSEIGDPDDEVEVGAIGCRLALREIYERVEFQEGGVGLRS
jgi:Uma2 family endonuclease